MRKPPKGLPVNEAPDWLINWFGDDYYFLSNFFVGPWPLMYDRDEYQTAEHLFQALKALTERDERKVREAGSPGEAKRLGRRIGLRPDWEAVKYDIMAMVVRVKFSRERPESRMLLDTGDALLIEGNVWNDTTWGVDLKDPEWPGRNWLGTLLMARRAELRCDVDGRNLGVLAYDSQVKASAWQFQMDSFKEEMK